MPCYPAIIPVSPPLPQPSVISWGILQPGTPGWKNTAHCLPESFDLSSKLPYNVRMREVNLKHGDPLVLTAAADARLVPITYHNDQIWELNLGGGDPPALAFQTSYGLRARSMRIFLRFLEADQLACDPAAFFRPPAVKLIFPNFILVHYSPFEGLDVEAEYWVPQSQTCGGRLRLINTGSRPRQIRIELVGHLLPHDGERMSSSVIQAAPVLVGRTGGLSPVVFITGGSQAGAGSFPNLSLGIDLAPGGLRQVSWTQAACATPEESFTLARGTAQQKWEAGRARVELLNSGGVEVYTGDPDWDAVFHLAQKTAFSLIVGPGSRLPAASFVLSRQPDQGFSGRGDGSDYNYLWNGQPALEAYYLSSLLLPSSPKLVEGFLENFFSTFEENGYIDLKPGLAGQRGRQLATPILATLCWRLYEASGDASLLDRHFNKLFAFFKSWFSPAHDRDQDGCPEWDNAIQAGSDEHPIYSLGHDWSLGVDISSAELPSLGAFLLREYQSLVKIAGILGTQETVSALEPYALRLKNNLEASWNKEEACYLGLDRDTHFSTPGDWLGQRQGAGSFVLHRDFAQPVRLFLRIQTDGESTRRPRIFIHGVNPAGKHRVEKIGSERFRWYLGQGSMTGDFVYSSVEKVDVQGLDEGDLVTLYNVAYNFIDLPSFLPLWAGIPDAQQAQAMVEKNLVNPARFWQPFGLSSCSRHIAQPLNSTCYSVNLPWNLLIGESLARYGFRNELAELVTRLMTGIVDTLKRDRAFRRSYDANTGQGYGERNALQGLAPLSLFLEALGVRLISPKRLSLSGPNPFPWPVTIKYRGMTILRKKEKSVVIFPDGQIANIEGLEPRLISLEPV